MPRLLQRCCLQDGLRLDINRLLRDGTIPRAMQGEKAGFAFCPLSRFRAGDSLCEPAAPLRWEAILFRVPGDGPPLLCFVAPQWSDPICEPAGMARPSRVSIAISGTHGARALCKGKDPATAV